MRELFPEEPDEFEVKTNETVCPECFLVRPATGECPNCE